jgi:hypothetical protein
VQHALVGAQRVLAREVGQADEHREVFGAIGQLPHRPQDPRAELCERQAEEAAPQHEHEANQPDRA